MIITGGGAITTGGLITTGGVTTTGGVATTVAGPAVAGGTVGGDTNPRVLTFARVCERRVVCLAPHSSASCLGVERSLPQGAELSLKVGDGKNRKGGISWGCLTTPLL